MRYNGHKLKKITEPQIFDPPKKMLVWNRIMDCAITSLVVAILERIDGICAICHDGEIYPYCAEIPEEPKPRRATNRELSKWLAQGNGEIFDEDDGDKRIWTLLQYLDTNENLEVLDGFKVRKWDDTEWHEPTVDYLEIEEAKHEVRQI